MPALPVDQIVFGDGDGTTCGGGRTDGVGDDLVQRDVAGWHGQRLHGKGRAA